MKGRTGGMVGGCVALALACLTVAADGGSGSGAAHAAAGKRLEPTAAGKRSPVRLVRVGKFVAPTYLTSPPGDRRRRFVTERDGTIRVIVGERKLKRPFLDIRKKVSSGGESGLLSMAFAPDFRRSRRYYVYYTDNRGAIRVDQYRASRRRPNRTQPKSGRKVIRVRHGRPNHKGGQLQFGHDGMLYLGLGDGGGGGDPDENAQDISKSLLGKLLRISPRRGGGYRNPRDNPFVGRPGRDEIFAYGLRNPYRFSFDRRTGDLALSDVGQSRFEEVNFLPVPRGKRRPRGGVNFGWDVFEGRDGYEAGSAPGNLKPVLVRSHDTGACSITGGYVIRDKTLGRRLQGQYVYGDLCSSGLRVAKLRLGRARRDRSLGVRVPLLVSFGEDGRGRVHAVSLKGGVFRLAPRRRG